MQKIAYRPGERTPYFAIRPRCGLPILASR
jgi:hypothetical protein